MSISETLKTRIDADVLDNSRSVNTIAKITGVSQPVLCRFLNDKRGLNLESIEKLCRFYGLELRRVER